MNKLMIKLVIGSEAIFFIALIISYLYCRQAFGFDPEAARYLDARKTGGYTLLLLASSGSFALAQRACLRARLGRFRLWMVVTLLMGGLFLAGQLREYGDLLGRHVTMGGSAFGSSFYTLTGFHALHVVIGLLALFILLLITRRGGLADGKSTAPAAIGLYWHFVDVVWLFVFFTIYLLPRIV